MEQREDKNIPSTEELMGMTSDRRFFKTVSNYMANVLGIDRDEIYKMLAEKIDARNVDQMVLESVERYFTVGHDAASGATDFVRRKISECVEDHVKAQFRKGAGAWMDGLIQGELDRMAGNARLDALDKARRPNVTGMRRPGLDLYAAGAWVDLKLLDNMVALWLAQNMPPMPEDRPRKFETDLKPLRTGQEAVVRIECKSQEAGLLAPLRPANDPPRPWANMVSVGDYGVKKIIAASLGWPAVSRIVAGEDGVAAFPEAL